MADAEFHIDREKLRNLAFSSDELFAIVDKETQDIASRANSLGAGFRTGKYHRDHKSPAVGGTAPSYVGDTQRRGKTPVGIVHPKNYAAMKDNHLHNTLLKSL